MTLFPALFLQILIISALLTTTVGASLLVILLIRDLKNNKVW